MVELTVTRCQYGWQCRPVARHASPARRPDNPKALQPVQDRHSGHVQHSPFNNISQGLDLSLGGPIGDVLSDLVFVMRIVTRTKAGPDTSMRRAIQTSSTHQSYRLRRLTNCSAGPGSKHKGGFFQDRLWRLHYPLLDGQHHFLHAPMIV
ncbi:hypothetical protein OG21DRAFT_1114354 [Imleria badia]|nr:hypothetical protein OG21DRAFT_1114354 [Imleria badia]